MRPLLLAALGAATLAACRGGQDSAGPELTHPKTSGAASKVRFKDAQEAASSLMPDYVRTIPLSTFASLEGLKVGVQIRANTSSGKLMVGTITAIGKDAVTVRVESWKDAGADPSPSK